MYTNDRKHFTLVDADFFVSADCYYFLTALSVHKLIQSNLSVSPKIRGTRLVWVVEGRGYSLRHQHPTFLPSVLQPRILHQIVICQAECSIRMLLRLLRLSRNTSERECECAGAGLFCQLDFSPALPGVVDWASYATEMSVGFWSTDTCTNASCKRASVQA